MLVLRILTAAVLVGCLFQARSGADEPPNQKLPSFEKIWNAPVAPPSNWEQLNARRSRDVERLLPILEWLPPAPSATKRGADDLLSPSEFLGAAAWPALDREEERQVVDAMHALGEIRATKATEPLAERLPFLSNAGNFVFTEPVPTVYHFPAAFALIEIGEPAVPDLLRVIERSDSSEFERRLAALTLLRIEVIPSDDFETDDVLAKERLLLLFEQRKRRTPPAVKDRYGRLVEWLKDYEEQHKDPRTIPGFLPDATTADAPSE